MNKRDNLGILTEVFVLVGLLLASPAIAGDYVKHKDGTVKDNNIGLIWQQSDDNVQRTWEDARDYCRNLSFAGHNDWRLPNHYELGTIRVAGAKYPAIDQDYFPGAKPARYWSGTELPYSNQRSFYIDFGDESLAEERKEEPKSKLEAMRWDNKYYSRCVRGKRKKVVKK
jgi:hypothetical protein